MTQQNDPHNHPTRRASSRAPYSPRTPYPSHRANSSRVSASQRMSVPHARDELEREREMYSAHDPNQNAPSPAQRYAQAQKNKAADQRQNYWARHPEESGYTNQPKAAQDSAYIKQPTYRNTHRSNANPSRTSRTPRVGEATLSGQIPRQDAPAASGPIPQQATPSASGAMPQQDTKDAYRNASPTRRSVSQKRSARTSAAPRPPGAARHIPESSDFGAER